MSGKIQVIFILILFLISASSAVVAGQKESLKIVRLQNNAIEESFAPLLSYYPHLHDFGDMGEGEVDNTTFEIWNSGCCSLSYYLIADQSWVDVSPSNGYSGGEHDIITVRIDTTGLASGSHSCNISIYSNVGSEIFTVMVNILDKDYIDIIVEEAWNLLTDTANGIQIPIDVRTDSEWINEHIDTPSPENPRLHCLCGLKNEIVLQEFMSLYDGTEIILYCQGGFRSAEAAQLLVDHDFNGIIYNMLGGITAWKAAGYPTKMNQPPSVEIANPREGYFHFFGNPLLPTPLDLLGDTLSLGGFRLRPIQVNVTDDYDERQDLLVKLYIDNEDRGYGTWNSETGYFEWLWTGVALGNYTLMINAKDTYGAESQSTTMDVWNYCFLP